MSGEPPIQKDPLVLNYATLDADGLPDWIPEAEAMIDVGSPPNRIRSLFRNSEQAVKYFAKSMARRFDAAHLSGNCAQCGCESSGIVLKVSWEATAKLRFLELHLSNSEAKVKFGTMHPVCKACADDWLRRFGAYRRCRKVTAWIGFATCAVFVTFIVFGYRLRLSQGTAYVAIVLAIGLYALSLVTDKAMHALWHYGLPGPVRHLMPVSVYIRGIEGIFTRQGDQLRAWSSE